MAVGSGPQSTLGPGDTVIESSFGERVSLSGNALSRWMGWRLRMLVLAALIGCLGLFLVARMMAGLPRIDASWRPDPQGQVELVRAADPALAAFVGQVLVAAQADGRTVEVKDALTLQRRGFALEVARRADRATFSLALEGFALGAARRAHAPAPMVAGGFCAPPR